MAVTGQNEGKEASEWVNEVVVWSLELEWKLGSYSLCLSDSARLECSLTFYSPSADRHANTPTAALASPGSQQRRWVEEERAHPHAPHDTP